MTDLSQGFGPSEAPEADGFGVAPQPLAPQPKPPVNASSVSNEYAMVSGEDPAAIKKEMEYLGPWQAIDRVFGTTHAAQQAAIRKDMRQSMAMGDANETARLAQQHVDEQARKEADDHLLIDKQISISKQAAAQLADPAGFKTDGEVGATTQDQGEKRGMFNTILADAVDYGNAALDKAESIYHDGISWDDFIKSQQHGFSMGARGVLETAGGVANVPTHIANFGISAINAGARALGFTGETKMSDLITGEKPSGDLIGFRFNTPDLGAKLADRLGLDTAQGAIQRTGVAAFQTGLEWLTLAKSATALGGALEAASKAPVTSGVLKAFGEHEAGQMVAGAASGAAEQGVKELGGTETQAVVAGLVAPLIPSLPSLLKLLSQGKLANVIKRTAGDKAAAGAVDDQLARAEAGVAGRGDADLSHHEAANSGMSTVDPMARLRDKIDGLAGPVQERLEKRVQDSWQKIQEARELVNKTAPETAPEVETAIRDMEMAHDPAVNKDVHSTELWEGGPKANYMSPDARPFMSKNGAELHMQEHGIQGEVVDVRNLEAKRFADESPTDARLRQQEGTNVPGNVTLKLSPDFALPTLVKDEINMKVRDEIAHLNTQGAEAVTAEEKAAVKQRYAELREIVAEKDPKTLVEKAGRAGLLDDAEHIIEGEAIRHEARADLINTMKKKFVGSRVQVMEGVGKEYKDLVKGLLNDFGLTEEKVVIGTFDDLAALHPDLSGSMQHGALGVYMHPEKDRPFHAIALNEVHMDLSGTGNAFNKARGLQTLPHEVGHLIYRVVLESDQFKPVRTALIRAFQESMDKNPKLAERFAKFRQSTSLATGEDSAAFKMQNLKELANSPSFMQWLNHEEWFVEGLSKAMFQHEQTLSHIEKAFKPVADMLRQMYKFIAQKLGYSTEQAPAIIEGWMRQHLKNVQEGRFDAQQLTYSERSASPGGRLNQAPTRDVGPEGYVIRTPAQQVNHYATLGKFSDEDINGMHYYALDPKHGSSEEAMQGRVIGVHVQDRIASVLRDHVAKPWQKLSKNGQRRVESVLVEGDAHSNLDGSTGKEYSATELMSAGLNNKEMEAYFAVRQAREMMWHLRNGEMVRELSASGHSNIAFSVVEGGKPATGTTSAVPGVGRQLDVVAKEVHPLDVNGRYIWDARANKGVTMTQEMADNIGAATVMKMRDPQQIGGKYFQHVIVDPKTAKRSAITSVLAHRPGEFARIYTDEYFAVAKRAGVQVDGVAPLEGFESVIRSAKSEKEVNAYVKSMNDAVAYMDGVRAGQIQARNPLTKIEELIGRHTDPQEFVAQHADGRFDGVKFGSKFTRTKDDYLNNFTGQSLNERPFYGERGGRIYSVDRNSPNTLSMMRSLEAEVTNVSRSVAVGEWRGTMIQKWMNTFGEMIPGRTGDDVRDFLQLADKGPLRLTTTDPRSKFAERTHDYIMKQLGIRTQEERMYQNWTRSFTEQGERNGWLPTTIGAAIRQSSPLNFIRSVNFNLQLGLYNPAQLLVQANGMATAAFIHPLHGLAAAKTYPLLRLALMSDNVAVHKLVGAAHSLSEMGLSSVDEFVQLVKAIRKTGVIENLRSTALHNMEDGKLGIVTSMGGKFLSGGRWFFNRGEELSRVVSFDIARREFMAARPGVDWTSNEALKQIVLRMDDFTQNMTKANQAFWQRGGFSIAGQFMQYNVKLMQNVGASITRGAERSAARLTGGEVKAYRGFTNAEALKILSGHLVMYGAAGYGAVNFMDEILGDKLSNSMSQVEKAALAQGAMSGLIAAYTSTQDNPAGTQIATGSRLASFDFLGRLASGLFSDHTTLWDAVLGPSKTTIDRLGAAAQIVGLWKVDARTTPQMLLEGAKAIGPELASTTRNGLRAYLYYQNKGLMIDKNGNAVARLNGEEMLATALGFQPTQAQDYYTLLADKHQRAQIINGLSELIYKLQRERVMAANRGDMETFNKKSRDIQLCWPKNAGDLHDVEMKIKKDYFPFDTEFQSMLSEFAHRNYHADGSTNPFTVTSPPGSNPQVPYGR